MNTPDPHRPLPPIDRGTRHRRPLAAALQLVLAGVFAAAVTACSGGGTSLPGAGRAAAGMLHGQNIARASRNLADRDRQPERTHGLLRVR